jgi:hypothetical protein
MAAGMASEASGGAAERWLVTCPSRGDLVASLADYFWRLGITARVTGPVELQLETTLVESVLRAYVEGWTAGNGVAVELERVREPVRLHEVGAPLPPPRLGELLIRKGLLTQEQLTWALAESRASNELLGLFLLRTQTIFEDELARTLSEQLSIPYVSIGRVGVSPHAAKLLPSEVGLEVAAIPVRLVDDSVQVAFADPTDPRAIDAVRKYLPRIEIAVAALSDIVVAWRQA